METPTRFFQANTGKIALACFEMAKRFQRGGRLLVFGNGTSSTDAQHIAVEFVHPVIASKRALPALALTNDVGSMLGIMNEFGFEEIYAQQLRLLATPDDIALGLTLDGNDENVLRGLLAAKQMRMLTVGMGGVDGGDLGHARGIDFCWVVPSENLNVVQQVHETTYHILWETVQIFFDHQDLWE
ncbi:MAG: SIS domain-containing protein [Chloroflexi bacterium]|nr:SIS domain-containing protein [Chloroflexota bacterium]